MEVTSSNNNNNNHHHNANININNINNINRLWAIANHMQLASAVPREVSDEVDGSECIGSVEPPLSSSTACSVADAISTAGLAAVRVSASSSYSSASCTSVATGATAHTFN